MNRDPRLSRRPPPALEDRRDLAQGLGAALTQGRGVLPPTKLHPGGERLGRHRAGTSTWFRDLAARKDVEVLTVP